MLRSMEIALSPQQKALVDWVRTGSGHAVVESVAGSGKTTSLVEVCKAAQGKILAIAFNKPIANELDQRFKANGLPNAYGKTVHAVAFSALRNAFPNVKLNENKHDDIVKEMGIPEYYHPFLKSIVSLGKAYGFGLKGLGFSPFTDMGAWNDLILHYDLLDKLPEMSRDNLEEVISWAVDIIEKAAKTSDKFCDFDDMLYAPIYHNVRFWQYDWVLIDEAQDTNPLRREVAKRSLKPNGRLIAVGDSRQAIYGFTGANADSMDLIRREFKNYSELPLTVSWRCPRAVVFEAQKFVPVIESAPNAPEGLVVHGTVEQSREMSKLVQMGDAILCRVTRPLVKLAYQFIRDGIPCHVEGRDIGRGLLVLANRWKSVKNPAILREKLDEYLSRETKKLSEKGGNTEYKLMALRDKVESLQAVIDGVLLLKPSATVDDVRTRIESLFVDSNKDENRDVTLVTIHKAKGREWLKVFIFGANVWMPHPMAKQDWEREQENNLCYVAITRSRQELVYIPVNKKEW